MLETEVDRANIEKMVRSFYQMLIKDDIVGPFFIQALGDDLKNDKWQEHYKLLDDFWLMLMTGEKGYKRDPFLPHVSIGKLYEETFERWLTLFDTHVHQHYIPKIAKKFNKKAEILAKKFMQGLEIGVNPDDKNWASYKL
ncbi:MAG: globin [Sulfurovum sp.]|nr:globin [Sulfurovum sp.]